MNKCYKCGSMFEGNFCPVCGTKHETPKFCPNCGAKLEPTTNFCPNCGYMLAPNDSGKVNDDRSANTKKIGSEKVNIKTVGKIFAYSKLTACILTALFAVLLFAFYATDIAFAVGDLDENFQPIMSSIGNIYTVIGNAEFGGLSVFAIILIVFAILALVNAIAYIAVYVKSKKFPVYIGKITLSFIFLCISIGVYLIFFIFGCVLMGQIAGIDGGEGAISAAACPKLIIAFSIIFLVIQIAIGVFQVLAVRKFSSVIAFDRTQPQAVDQATTATAENRNSQLAEYAAINAKERARKKHELFNAKIAKISFLDLPEVSPVRLSDDEQLIALKIIRRHVKSVAICKTFMFAILLFPLAIFGLLFLLKSPWGWRPQKIKSTKKSLICMMIFSAILEVGALYLMLFLVDFSTYEWVKYFVTVMGLIAMFFYLVTFFMSIAEIVRTRKLAVIFYGTTKITSTDCPKADMGNLFDALVRRGNEKIDADLDTRLKKIETMYN